MGIGEQIGKAGGKYADTVKDGVGCLWNNYADITKDICNLIA